MRYALIHPDSHVADVQDLDSEPQWQYTEDFTVVQADGFEPDPQYDLSVYLYSDGMFSLDAERANAVPPLQAFEVLTAIFSAQPETLEQLPDESLARMAPYMQEWEPGVAYQGGNLRSYLELPYRCLQAHTSQETWNPADAPSLWAKVLIPDPSVIPEWEQPGSTNPYMKGDKVRHNGYIWVSDYDNNVWEPGVFGWTMTALG